MKWRRSAVIAIGKLSATLGAEVTEILNAVLSRYSATSEIIDFTDFDLKKADERLSLTPI